MVLAGALRPRQPSDWRDMPKRICGTCRKTYQPGLPCHQQKAATSSPRKSKQSQTDRSQQMMGAGVPRGRYYGAEWQRHSRARRAEQPWCSVCYRDDDLTVDHPTDAVLCRSCHGRLEHNRRQHQVRAKQLRTKAPPFDEEG